MTQGSGKRGTHARVEMRVNAVYGWMLLGYSHPRMYTLADAEGWNVSHRTVRMYIAKAQARFKAEAERDRAEERGKARARLERLYRNAVERKDHRGALMVGQEISKLGDLYPSSRFEVSGPNGGPIEFADAATQARERLAGGIARIAARQRADEPAGEPD